MTDAGPDEIAEDDGGAGVATGMRVGTTLPRDNVLMDFLESAERKFRGFSNKPRTGLLVVR